MGSVDPIPALAGKVMCGGRLNVTAALETLLGQGAARSSPPPAPPLPPLTTEELDLSIGYAVLPDNLPPEGANATEWQVGPCCRGRVRGQRRQPPTPLLHARREAPRR